MYHYQLRKKLLLRTLNLAHNLENWVHTYQFIVTWRKLSLVSKTFGLTIVENTTSVLRPHNCALHNSWTFLLCVVSSLKLVFFTSLLILLQRWEFCANATTVMYTQKLLLHFAYEYLRNAQTSQSNMALAFFCVNENGNLRCFLALYCMVLLFFTTG